MSDMNALAQKLAALTSQDTVFDGAARVVSDAGSPSPLVAILREIDDTVLERNLTFQCDQATFDLSVAGRRLRGIISVTPGTVSDAVGHILSRDDPDLTQSAFDLLQNLCGDADYLTVRIHPPEPFGKGDERGISATGLAELWQVDLNEAPLPPMERFLKGNAASFSSTLHVSNGEVASKSGDFKALQKIWTSQAESFRKAHKKTLRGDDGAQLICLDGAFEDGKSVAMAVSKGEVALIAYESDDYGALQASWQRIFH